MTATEKQVALRAMDFLHDHDGLRPGSRIVGAFMLLQGVLEGGFHPRTEAEWAALLGMKPAAVRQAMVELRALGEVVREYVSLNDQRPVAIFRLSGSEERAA